VAIVQDTVIKWNYPLAGNEDTIGIDMLTIPDQADDILYVKENLVEGFSGPVVLIQGGKGYIIRSPILKNGSFWGIASIILKEENIVKLFDAYAKENSLEVSIKNNDNEIIYGTKENINKNTYKFERKLLSEDLSYFVKPLEHTTINQLPYFIVIIIGGLIIVAYATYQAYLFFKGHEEILHKNYILKSSAIRDRLTGIFNRDYLDISINEEMKFANNSKTSVSLIYLDINKFKNINDTYGHAFGDGVLQEFAAAIKVVLRNRDVFARWGGDEFAVLMPDTNIRGAEITAEKIRMAIEAIDYNGIGNLTASIGVAEYNLGESADSWFKRVDKALYMSKAKKDNTICTCDYVGNINCNEKKA
jgi:diguanylate cyclase (GGDEF)-like protein